MIPERVVVVTSVTLSRSRRFQTPLGAFTYRHLSAHKYSIGIHQQTLGDGTAFLIAAPVKALADKLYESRWAPRTAAIGIENSNVEKAREEVLPFVLDPRSVEIWSRSFFLSLIDKIDLK